MRRRFRFSSLSFDITSGFIYTSNMTTDFIKVESFIIIISLHGFLLAALMAIGQIISDSKSIKNWLFFGLFLDLSFFQLHYTLFAAGLIYTYHLFSFLPISAFFLLGPIVMLLTRYTVENRFKRTHCLWIHFIPVIVFTILSIMVLCFSPNNTATLFSGYFYNEINQIIGCLGSVSLLIYIIWSIHIFYSKHLIRRNIFKAEPGQMIIMLLVVTLAVTWLSDLIAGITGIKIFMTLSILLISILVVTLFLINSKYPHFQKQIQQIVAREKLRRSYLNSVHMPDLELKLNRMIMEEKIYLDENLSLSQMADKMNITTHQLSEFLNTQLGKNFNTFINQHRIETAKYLLEKDQDLSILSVAFESGFKSKSTFNSVFVKQTGMTPKEYRKIRIDHHKPS